MKMNDLYKPEDFNKLFTPVDSFNALSGSNFLSRIFKEGDRLNYSRANEVLNMLLASSPVFANIIESMKTTETVKVMFSDKAIEMMKAGLWKIPESKATDGLLRAWLIDENGHIVEHAELGITQQAQGINLIQLANAMQSMVMMKQLAKISKQINTLNERIDEIKMGQQNDRIGLFFAAENIYRESEFLTNNEMRDRLVAMAVTKLSECIEQTKQTTLSDSNAIVRNYDAQRNTFKDLKKNSQLTPTIKNNLQLIHAASILKAGIYYKENEIQSTVCALHEYKMFLEAFLPDENSYRALYYADNNSSAVGEFWGARKNLPIIFNNTCTALSDPNQVCLYYSRGGRTL